MSESTLRQAHRRDIPRLAELWAHAFPGERTIEDRIRQLEAGGVYGSIEHAWYIEQDGLLAGALRGYALTQYLHGTPYPMLGVAAVAVAAHARRRGVGGELCRQLLRIGHERGDRVSVLYPFRPDFYQRLGWGLTGVLHRHRCRAASIPVAVARPRVRLGTGDDLSGIEACYARAAVQSHGLLRRTDRIWKNHQSLARRHVFVLAEDRAVRGYVVVQYGRSRSAEDRTLLVSELVADDHAAYLELLSWLSLQRDEWPLLEYHATPEERFELRLQDPRPPHFRPVRSLWSSSGQLIRGPMLRVLDVPGALHLRKHWPQTTSFRATLRVHDPELPVNEGPWSLVFDGDTLLCERTSADLPDLEMAAPEFAQLFAGEISVREAVLLGRATCRIDPEPIDAAFRSGRTLRLLDEF